MNQFGLFSQKNGSSCVLVGVFDTREEAEFIFTDCVGAVREYNQSETWFIQQVEILAKSPSLCWDHSLKSFNKP